MYQLLHFKEIHSLLHTLECITGLNCLMWNKLKRYWTSVYKRRSKMEH